MNLNTRKGLSHREAGRIGGLKSIDISKKLKQERVNKYLENPKLCFHCKGVIDYEKKINKFCSQRCSGIVNSTGVRRHGNAPLMCLSCGKSTGRGYKKYCSRKCYEQDRKEKREENFLNGEVIGRSTLRKHLIGHRGHKCEVCNNTEWMRQLIPIELDHIDGNSENNSPENLRLICCNCHAQTPTYKSKNVGKGRAKRRQRYKEGKSY